MVAELIIAISVQWSEQIFPVLVTWPGEVWIKLILEDVDWLSHFVQSKEAILVFVHCLELFRQPGFFILVTFEPDKETNDAALELWGLLEIHVVLSYIFHLVSSNMWF